MYNHASAITSLCLLIGSPAWGSPYIEPPLSAIGPNHQDLFLHDPMDHPIEICGEHFPPGSPARTAIDQAIAAYNDSPGLDIQLVPVEIAVHRDSDQLFPVPATASTIAYVDPRDPLTRCTGPDTSWSARICWNYYDTGDWECDRDLYACDRNDFMTIMINEDHFTHDDPGADPYADSGFFDAAGLTHELGHAFSFTHGGARPAVDQGYQTTMGQGLSILTAFDKMILDATHTYESSDPAETAAALIPELAASPRISILHANAALDTTKESFGDATYDLYLDVDEYLDCRTDAPPDFVGQFFDMSRETYEDDVLVRFGMITDWTPATGVLLHEEGIDFSYDGEEYHQITVRSDGTLLPSSLVGTPAAGESYMTATLGLVLDPGNTVIELDETNNIAEAEQRLWAGVEHCPNYPEKLVYIDRDSELGLGASVAASGNRVIAGAPGASNGGQVLIGRWDHGLTTWEGSGVYAPAEVQPGDRFGSRVAAKGGGNNVSYVVGALRHDTVDGAPVVDAGAAWVYPFDAPPQMLVGQGVNGIQAGDYFGQAVDLSANHTTASTTAIVAVGAPGHDYDEAGGSFVEDAGAVFLFEEVGGSYVFLQKLVAQGSAGRNAGDEFGASLALTSGDEAVLVVGAPGSDLDRDGLNAVDDAGAIQVFTFDVDTGSFVYDETHTAPTRGADDRFGTSVDVDSGARGSDWIIVGAPYDDTDASGGDPQPNAGAAHVFERVGPGAQFSHYAKLAADEYRWNSEQYGQSVAIDGWSISVGCPGCSYGGDPWGGAAFLYDLKGHDAPALLERVQPDELDDSSSFGIDVALGNDGELRAYGASGHFVHIGPGFSVPNGAIWASND